MIGWFKTVQISGILLCICTAGYAGDLNVVNHKNTQLGLYLDEIRYNTHEKIGILPYILKNLKGKYLEIGTGGDPIAELLHKVPSDADITVIASDVDKQVLDSLLLRHPELQRYQEKESPVQLDLQQLNAVDMSVFDNGELHGINASSVVHEIISYAGGFDSCKKFFQEACRVLEPGGVLVYRDPESVQNKHEQVTVSLYNKVSKLFAHVFIYKFLDTRGSVLADAGKKVILYDTNNITFYVYKKNEIKPVVLSYEEYLQTPSYDIDFSREYKIEMPAGLNRELLRHYLTYLHSCNPLVFAKMIPNLSTGTSLLNYYAHSTSNVVQEFLQFHGYQLQDHQIGLEHNALILSEIEKKCQVLEFGIPLHFASKKKEIQLRSLLKDYGFNPSMHIVTVDEKTCLLDYRVFGLLYDHISALFDDKNAPVDTQEESHALWLKREGEEVYCYYSIDELLSNVLLHTYEQSQKVGGMVLCPINVESSLFVDRWCYTELLKETFYVTDSFGYSQKVFDGKRIVHFGKKPLLEALDICDDIVKSDSSMYPLLNQTVQKLRTTL